MAKLNELTIVTNAVRRFRKELSRFARIGHLTTRIVGNRKDGFFVAVQRGLKVIIVSVRFAYKGLAEAWNLRKHHQTAPTRTINLTAQAA